MQITPRNFTIFFFLFCFIQISFSQEIIQLNNPSFEDTPRYGKSPTGWFDCGHENESPPDVHVVEGGSFGVRAAAIDGETYMGLIVRDNDTWEAVGQRLPSALEAGQCYDFSLYLARSEVYLSFGRMTQEEANYVTPVKIRIWGGNNFCTQVELLGETELVTNTDWLLYYFRFQPKTSLNYIVIESYYKTPINHAYNGNVLVDKASNITKVNCDSILLQLSSRIPVEVQNRIFSESLAVSNSNPKRRTKKKRKATISLEKNAARDKQEIQPRVDISIWNSSFEHLDSKQFAVNWANCHEEDLAKIESQQDEEKKGQLPLAADGQHYLSLRTNDNTLYGVVRKNLDKLMVKGSCYTFSFQACQAETYFAPSDFLDHETNYDEPIIVQVWGTNPACEHVELLAQTPPITHADWQNYQLVLTPQENHASISIEVHCAAGGDVQFFANGNVLIDKLSNIEITACDSLEYKTNIPPDTRENILPPFKWANSTQIPINKRSKSYTYSVRDSDLSINEDLKPILVRAFPNYELLFNIYAPTKKEAKRQRMLLADALFELEYPKSWYKTKIYLED